MHRFLDYILSSFKRYSRTYFINFIDFFSFNISQVIVTFLIIAGCVFIKQHFSINSHIRTLHICFHTDYLPQQIVLAFEQEYKIKIKQSVLDGMEPILLRLLNKNSGYDVVYVTEAPFFQRGVFYNLFEPIPWEKIKNSALINPWCLQRLQITDPYNMYGVPLLWGTLGFYTVTDIWKNHMIAARYPHPNSFSLIFDEDILSLMSHERIVLPDSYIEVLQSIAIWKKNSPYNLKHDTIKELLKNLYNARRFWYRFESHQFFHWLRRREILLAYGDCGVIKNIYNLKLEHEIEYNLPVEGAVTWIDTICIPKNGNIVDAALFIDFLLRPENLAILAQHNVLTPSVTSALELIPDTFKAKKYLNPSQNLLAPIEKVTVDTQNMPKKHIRQFAPYDAPEFSRDWIHVKFQYY